MRLFYLLLSVLTWAQIGTAQDDTTELLAAVPSLPTCAQSCLMTALDHSPCQPTDQKCLCTSAQFIGATDACVMKSCTLMQSLFTKNTTTTLCNAPMRDESDKIRVTNIIIVVLAATCCALRIFHKCLTSGLKGLDVDDYIVLGATILGIATVIIIDRGVIPNGIGKDVWAVPFENITRFSFWLYILTLTYFLMVPTVKLALLFFFLRIFPKTWTRRLLWATVVFNVIYGIVFIIVGVFQCRPISYYWTQWDDTSSTSGHCNNLNAIAWSNAIISIVIDIWMLALPLYEVYHLQLSWRRKICVSLMFLVGTFITVVSGLRLQSLVKFATSMNPTWDQAQIIHWSNIEMGVGVVCICMPSIRIMLVRLFPKALGSRRDATHVYSKEGNRSGAGGPHIFKSGLDKRSSRAPHAITYAQTYAVHRGDGDEISLVQMEDLESKAPKASSTHTSEISM
ncbi:hypothetical protein HBI71_004250 [Parastagonospora nodorum]|nr:hypothetical protein HBI71_004250 [Parastagonospora nodorum]KAH5425011.1 hypothetical protein HBI47_125600 [Parastagonospora nodorum]